MARLTRRPDELARASRSPPMGDLGVMRAMMGVVMVMMMMMRVMRGVGEARTREEQQRDP
jgi:hypothetical protein